MLETIFAVGGALALFAKGVSIIKAFLFAEEAIKKLSTNDRKEFIVAHVYEEHEQPLKWCSADQCSDF